jgi:hypothetical protein
MPLIVFDEWVFHLKRGLPKWERLGHPLDTLSVIICLSLPAFLAYSPAMLKVYIALSVFSCLMVTKDEWVHKHHCPAAEHWVHALLFLNHPILLTGGGFLWFSGLGWTQLFLKAQLCFAFIFMLYQAIYWNFYAPKPAPD